MFWNLSKTTLLETDVLENIPKFLILLLVSVDLVSCGDNHASLTDEALNYMDEAIEVLKELVDDGDPEEGIKDPKALAERSADLEKRMVERAVVNPMNRATSNSEAKATSTLDSSRRSQGK